MLTKQDKILLHLEFEGKTKWPAIRLMCQKVLEILWDKKMSDDQVTIEEVRHVGTYYSQVTDRYKITVTYENDGFRSETCHNLEVAQPKHGYIHVTLFLNYNRICNKKAEDMVRFLVVQRYITSSLFDE